MDKINPIDGLSRRLDYRDSEISQSGKEEGYLPTLYNKLKIASLIFKKLIYILEKALYIIYLTIIDRVDKTGLRYP